ncbi:MAG: hypothetical protein HRU25_02650 [Psychrobium sp.]|nr:hypothetical protein [Psychrobium sp.]
MSISPEILTEQSTPHIPQNNASLDNKPEDSAIPQDTSSSPPLNDKSENSALAREWQLMEKQRHKIRLCDPRGVYFYRHIPCGWFASLLHFVTLLISSLLIAAAFLFWLFLPKVVEVDVIGVGSVANVTIIDALELFFTALIVTIGIHRLVRQTRKFSVKRYGMAMLANACNRVIVSYLKLTIYVSALLMVGVFSVLENEQDASFLFERLSNGVVGDVVSVMGSVASIIIFYRAFSSCHKELSLCD